MYALEYRARVYQGKYADRQWSEVQRFDDVTDANSARDAAVKYEVRGTKDWRVRPVS